MIIKDLKTAFFKRKYKLKMNDKYCPKCGNKGYLSNSIGEQHCNNCGFGCKLVIKEVGYEFYG